MVGNGWGYISWYDVRVYLICLFCLYIHVWFCSGERKAMYLTGHLLYHINGKFLTEQIVTSYSHYSNISWYKKRDVFFEQTNCIGPPRAEVDIFRRGFFISTFFNIFRRRTMSNDVEKCRKMSNDVEKCRKMSKIVENSVRLLAVELEPPLYVIAIITCQNGMPKGSIGFVNDYQHAC